MGQTNESNERARNGRTGKIDNDNNYDLNSCDEDPVDLPPMVVTGYYNAGPAYFWMGGGSWFYYLHPNSGGGVSSNNVSDSKLEFCLVVFKILCHFQTC